MCIRDRSTWLTPTSGSSPPITAASSMCRQGSSRSTTSSAVSYTHLDVYKRQGISGGFNAEASHTVQEFHADLWVVGSGAAGPFLGSSLVPASRVTEIARLPGVVLSLIHIFRAMFRSGVALMPTSPTDSSTRPRARGRLPGSRARRPRRTGRSRGLAGRAPAAPR